MAKFKRYKIEILIEEGSDLDKRLRAYCMAENGKVTAGGMEDALSYAVRLGVYGHINQNLGLMERCLPDIRHPNEGGINGTEKCRT